MDQPEDEVSVERRQYLQRVLAAYEAFAASDGLSYYREGRVLEIRGLRDDIVSMDPIDRAGEIESYKVRGDLRTTEEFETLFQDTIASLKTRIEELLDAEKPKQ